MENRHLGNRHGRWTPVNLSCLRACNPAFLGEDYPSTVWALASESVMNVCFRPQRFELEVSEGMARCRIDNPGQDHVYGVWREE